MLETPHITQSTPQQAAVIHLTIPRDQIRTMMGPSIQEVIDTVVAPAQTVLHGGYEGLPDGYGQFMAWLDKEGMPKAPDLWEIYMKGPESDPDPSTWRTELNQPLLG